MTFMKWIFIYVKGIEYYGLWYKQDDKYNLKFYTNVGWARNVNDRKSTSCGAFFLG
jgi:hypothetical protein